MLQFGIWVYAKGFYNANSNICMHLFFGFFTLFYLLDLYPALLLEAIIQVVHNEVALQNQNMNKI